MPVQLERRKDGLLEVRVSMREFTLWWRRSPPDDHLVLEEPGSRRRPAVWSSREDRMVIAPHPANWEDYQRRARRGAQTIGKRERQCRQCGATLELSKELTDMWTFWCKVCRSIEMHGKDRVGGTIGAGEAEPDGA